MQFVISRNEKSSQVTPQRKANLCRASNEDFSSVEMTKKEKNQKKSAKSDKSTGVNFPADLAD
ncbi:hypothetical protein FLGSB24_34620 [Flavobacterium sp. GSB-24]|nr:hypothetical protein FLGSB24_34620 [Flavobacterium sp. GSB-24]